MSKATKILLLIFGAVVGVVVVMLLATWIWWAVKSDDIKIAARDAANAGFTVGVTKDENGCMAASFERLKDPTRQNASAAMLEGYWAAGCLENAKISDRFCEGVPATTSPVTIGQWARGYCDQRGDKNPYCGAALSLVPQHCASDDRAQKLKAPANPAG